MIPKLRNCQNLRRKREICVIVCGICRGVDKEKISKRHNWPKKTRKCCTKIKPVLCKILVFLTRMRIVFVCILQYHHGGRGSRLVYPPTPLLDRTAHTTHEKSRVINYQQVYKKPSFYTYTQQSRRETGSHPIIVKSNQCPARKKTHQKDFLSTQKG